MKNKEYEKAIEYLTAQIKSGALSVGSRLPAEREISETLSIGRNSTREALRTLENMGLVESRRGSGNYLVCKFGNTISNIVNMMMLLHHISMDEICEFRRQMEKAVGSLLISFREVSAEDMNELKHLLQDPITPASEAQQDDAFHYKLIHMTENQFLIDIMESIHDIYSRCISDVLQHADQDLKQQLADCHRDMTAAIETENLSALNDAIDRHYDLIEIQTMKKTTVFV